MDISHEQLAIVLTIVLTVVRVGETVIAKLFSMITGKENGIDRITKQIELANGNHLNHMQKSLEKLVNQNVQIIKQNDHTGAQHDSQILLLGEIKGKLNN